MSQTVDEILDFAIEREQSAHDFYMELASRMDRQSMKDVFIQYAKEELGHRRRLEGVKAGKKASLGKDGVLDLKLADYILPADPGPTMDYEEALVLAMQREAKAHALYVDLAGQASDEGLKQLFLRLASEEAKHRERFELEYDEVALVQN